MNVKVEGGSVKGQQYTGGLIGQATSYKQTTTTINSTCSTADVLGTNYTGWINR